MYVICIYVTNKKFNGVIPLQQMQDEASPPREHTDLYALALQKKRVKHCRWGQMAAGWPDTRGIHVYYINIS